MSATNITVGSDSVSLWTTYLLRKFVDGLKAELFFTDYAQPAQIPKGAGGYVARWNIPTMRIGTTADAALTDGTSGSAIGGVTMTGVEGTITDYGEWINVTDLAKESQLSGAMDVYSEIMSYAGSGIINKLIYEAGLGATHFLHAQDSTIDGLTMTGAETLGAADVAKVSSFFRGKDAKGFSALNGDFMLAVHPDAEYEMVTEVTTGRIAWTDIKQHTPAGYDNLIANHRFVGRLQGVSVLRTTLIGTVTEDVAAHRNLALAKWGIGWLGLGSSPSNMPDIKFKRPGPQSTNDPLDTNCTLGWKVRMAAKLLDAGNRAFVVYTDAS